MRRTKVLNALLRRFFSSCLPFPHMLSFFQSYGLLGLFLGSFLAATVVPFSSDALYAGVLLAGCPRSRVFWLGPWATGLAASPPLPSVGWASGSGSSGGFVSLALNSSSSVAASTAGVLGWHCSHGCPLWAMSLPSRWASTASRHSRAPSLC